MLYVRLDRVVLRWGVPALLDFWAEWCTPCRMLAPVLAEIAEAYGDALNVVKVNVDDCPAIAEHYGVASIPFLVICRGDEVLKNLPGIRPKPVLLNELKSGIGSASTS